MASEVTRGSARRLSPNSARARNFSRYAFEYLELGYVPIPLLSGKGLTPKGATGYASVEVNQSRIETWIQEHTNAALCLRLDGLIGIDVDHYGGKTGGDHLQDLEGRLGALPATARISSRFGEDYDGKSGIKLYRIPEAYLHLEHKAAWKSGPCPGVDLVRRAHRNANAYPTVHKRGTQYGYMDESTAVVTYGVLPPAHTLPEAPSQWIEHLLKDQTAAGRAKDQRLRIRRTIDPSDLDWVTPGEVPCARMEEVLAESLSALRTTAMGGRHDSVLAAVLRLVRTGESGHAGVALALSALAGAFASATRADGSRDEWELETEWQRMEDGAFSLVLEDSTPSVARRCCIEIDSCLDHLGIELHSEDVDLSDVVVL